MVPGDRRPAVRATAALHAFYDAVFPRLGEALAYCDPFPLGDLPDDARRLLQLVHSVTVVAMAVEVWQQPTVINGGHARLDRIAEPRP